MPDGLPTGNISVSLPHYPTASTMDEKEKTKRAANDGRERYMRQAIDLSIENVRKGGGPFGAVIVRDGRVIATGTNRVVPGCDRRPTPK